MEVPFHILTYIASTTVQVRNIFSKKNLNQLIKQSSSVQTFNIPSTNVLTKHTNLFLVFNFNYKIQLFHNNIGNSSSSQARISLFVYINIIKIWSWFCLCLNHMSETKCLQLTIISVYKNQNVVYKINEMGRVIDD